MRVHQASCIEVSPANNCTSVPKLKSILQFKQEDSTQIWNVQFYFYIWFGKDWHPLAMIRLFSLPDPQVFMDSSKMVYLSKLLSGSGSLIAIPVTAIHSIVMMIPEMAITEGGRITETGKFSLMHHAFLKLAQFSNSELFEDDSE